MRRRTFLLGGAALAVTPLGCGGADGGEAPRVVVSTLPPWLDGTQVPAAGEDASGAGDDEEPAEPEEPEEPDDAEEPDDRPDVDPADYPTTATEWGERVTGVKTRMDTDEPVVALTFDACGGSNGVGYDEQLIDFLLAESIPATLFFNHRWIVANEALFVQLAAEPTFEVANHGWEHRPLSVNGNSIYGLTGTADPAGVIDEVMTCQEAIEERTGLWPRYFRAGTAYCDEVAVRIVNDLGLDVVNFDVLGDAGATYTAAQVTAALDGATAGSIALLHMNQPGSGTAEGVRRAVPALRDRGLGFVKLSEHPLA